MGTATVGNAAQRPEKAKPHDTARSPRERYPTDRFERVHGATRANAHAGTPRDAPTDRNARTTG